MGENNSGYNLYLIDIDGELVDLGEIVDADKIDLSKRSRRARMKLRAINLMYGSVWGKNVKLTIKCGMLFDVGSVLREEAEV